MTSESERATRFPLLKTLKEFSARGSKVEASILTTYTLNAVFYEEVLLRAFERAGSRLNILMVDARQLAATVADPLRRPQRAGRDYLLVPMTASGAYHPKVLALLGSKASVLAIGSHNATDPGFSRNEEVTGFWGPQSKGAPEAVLIAAVSYCLERLSTSQALQEPLLSEVQARIRSLAGAATTPAEPDVFFVGSTPTGAPLWDQVSPLINGPVERAYVVGPYFDGDLHLLRHIADQLAPREIIVGVQPGTAILTNPERAPPETRFVNSAALETFWRGDGPIGFAHGKLLAFETKAGPVVTLGSANPTGAAWLDGQVRNAEANLVLTGAAAIDAFQRTGLARLTAAEALPQVQLASIGERSRETRRLEREREAHEPSIPAVAGRRVDDGILVPGVEAMACRGATLLGADEVRLAEATFVSADGAVMLSTTSPLPVAGLLRIDGERHPVCMVVINDEPHFRTSTRPKDAARLLDTLGRLDDYDGFEELFDLFDRHIFGDSGQAADPSRSPTGKPPQQADGAQTDESKPGPRGVSLMATEAERAKKRALEGGLIADFISALMRELAPPTPPRDGDARDLDTEDAGDGEQAGEEVAGAGEPDAVTVDWPRLVTACRVRVGHLLGRLDKRLAEKSPSADRAAWLFIRTLTVLCLLQRLRTQPPPANIDALRPDSLVATNQLRKAFDLAVDAIYGGGALADILEKSPDHRASQERARMDAVLLWIAREVGADFDARAAFLEAPEAKMRRLQDKADLVVIAMSAAADCDSDTIPDRTAAMARWSDAVAAQPDWGARHVQLGRQLQIHLLGGATEPTPMAIKGGEFALWKMEPGLPRLVRSISGNKVHLMEPGGLQKDRVIDAAWLKGIDLTGLLSSTRPDPLP